MARPSKRGQAHDYLTMMLRSLYGNQQENAAEERLCESIDALVHLPGIPAAAIEHLADVVLHAMAVGRDRADRSWQGIRAREQASPMVGD